MDDLTEGLNEAADASIWDLLLALTVFVVGLVVAWLIARGIGALLNRFTGLSPGVGHNIARATQTVLGIAAAAVALSLLDTGTGWTAILVIVGIILAVVAAQPLFVNLTSSMVLPYVIGDQIAVGEYYGTVVDITARLTVIRPLTGETVHLRHKDVVEQPIIILTAHPYRRSSMEVAVAADASIDDLTRLLADALDGLDHVRSEPSPEILPIALGSEGLTLKIQWHHDPDLRTEELVEGEVLTAVKNAFDAAGIELARPSVEVRSDSMSFSEPRSDTAPSPRPESSTDEDQH